MSKLNPIYTEIRECQDCNKCIRECPVKGIKVIAGHAIIEPELCILCGHCTKVCPMRAKKIRDDLKRGKDLVKKRIIIASVAPSYISEFPGISFELLKTALLQLGFSGAEETALGAQEVSRHVNKKLKEGGVHISSACPVTNSYIKKYRPEYAQNILTLDSPLLAHCRDIKRNNGSDCGIIFFGPCIAKKMESDLYPELLDVTLTFKDLRRWLEENEILLESLKPSLVERKATNGNFYPIEGGMVKSLQEEGLQQTLSFSYSGISSIINALDGLDQISPDKSGVFFELLACDGGCINGPGASCNSKTALKTIQVLSTAIKKKELNPKALNIDNNWLISPIEVESFPENEIKDVMRSIGKVLPEDEINCSACGYSTCREFSTAMLSGKAEINMCLSYLRKLSEKKANALIHTMPSGVIMVDSTLNIIESNRSFAKLIGEDYETIYTVNDGLNGVSISKILSNTDIFTHCLETGVSSEKIIKIKGKIIKCIVYSVVDFLVVGGIFRDITEPRVQRERIISKAQDVLKKNVKTVQQIAYLLGESAAESEVMLNSIIESFGQVEADDSGV